MAMSNAPITANAHTYCAISISSLFIATQLYEVWRRSHGRSVAARTILLVSGRADDGLQAITYPIISTGRVRVRRKAGMGREGWAIGSRIKLRSFQERDRVVRAGAMARRRRCSSPRTDA